MKEEKDNIFITRCFDIARLGAGHTAPNPMVGAVLVFQGRIIGEGYHELYGTAHAEVNAVNSVKPADKHLISKSTIYVSLEPCCIYGKTPPCSSLILENKIPRVVIAGFDQTPGVDGQSVDLLRSKGVEVTTGVLYKDGNWLSRRRNTFVSQNRPYIILKYAQSKDGFIGIDGRQEWITNPLSKRLVHKWRKEESAILIGRQTALVDNPRLDNRYFDGPSPLRIVIDPNLSLPKDLNLFKDGRETIVFHYATANNNTYADVRLIALDTQKDNLTQIMTHLFKLKVLSLIVEGGAKTLAEFIQTGLWDEARVLTGNKYFFQGIPAPKLLNGLQHEKTSILDDELTVFTNQNRLTTHLKTTR